RARPSPSPVPPPAPRLPHPPRASPCPSLTSLPPAGSPTFFPRLSFAWFCLGARLARLATDMFPPPERRQRAKRGEPSEAVDRLRRRDDRERSIGLEEHLALTLVPPAP